MEQLKDKLTKTTQKRGAKKKGFKIIREVTLKYKKGERVYKYKMNQPSAVYEFLKDKIADEAQENVICLYPNSMNIIQGWSLTSRGALDSTIVHSREVFKYALLLNSNSVILAHNHPSGELKPTQEDIEITKRLVEAGRIIGIPIQDHLILTGDGFYSFKENDLC